MKDYQNGESSKDILFNTIVHDPRRHDARHSALAELVVDQQAVNSQPLSQLLDSHHEALLNDEQEQEFISYFKSLNQGSQQAMMDKQAAT